MLKQSWSNTIYSFDYVFNNKVYNMSIKSCFMKVLRVVSNKQLLKRRNGSPAKTISHIKLFALPKFGKKLRDWGVISCIVYQRDA